MIPLAQNPHLNLKKKFLFSTTRCHESLQGLNSSLAQSAAKLQLAKVGPEVANYTFCETFRFLSKTGFLSHNSASRYARKSIKGSKDADFGLVQKKNLSQKYGSLGWRTGPDKFAKNSKTCPHCDITFR